MKNEVRTTKGQLIGIHDLVSDTFQIKDGKKLITITISTEGMTLKFDPGNKIVEQVFVPSCRGKPYIA